jgi:hypothetical protein
MRLALIAATPLLLGTVVVAAPLPAQQFEGIVTIRTIVFSSDQVAEQAGGQEKLFRLGVDELVQLGAATEANVMQVKGGRMRTAIVEMPGLGSAYMLLDAAQGLMHMIAPSRRAYYEVSLRGRPGTPTPTEEEDMTIEPLGQTRVINGLRCTGYRVTQGDQVSRAWTTNDPVLKGLMLDQLRMAGGEEDDPAVRQTRAILARYGAPVMTQEVDEEGSYRVEVWSFERKSLPDSLFVVPAGFTKLKMPGS